MLGFCINTPNQREKMKRSKECGTSAENNKCEAVEGEEAREKWANEQKTWEKRKWTEQEQRRRNKTVKRKV